MSVLIPGEPVAPASPTLVRVKINNRTQSER